MGDTLNRVVDTMRAAPAPNSPPARPAAPPNDPRALETQFWKDPLGMTQAIAQAAVAQAAQQPNPALDTLIETARTQARSKDPGVFDLLLAEIEAKVKGMPPQFHQSVSVWNNAFNMAVGENLQKVLEHRKQAAPPAAPAAAATPAIGGGPAAPSPRQPAPPPEAPLNDDEKDFIKKFGISEDGYRRGIQYRDSQGDGKPGTPSAWDAVLTFDSDVKKRREKERAQKEKK